MNNQFFRTSNSNLILGSMVHLDLFFKTSSTCFLLKQRSYKSSLSISLHKAEWHHWQRVMTFLPPVLWDIGTIFRIPKRVTSCHCTASRDSQKTEDCSWAAPILSAFMGLLSWSGDITDRYMCNAAVASRCFLIETIPLIARIDLHEWRTYFFLSGIQNTISRKS